MELEMFALRVTAAVILPILIFQSLKKNDLTSEDLLKDRIRWVLIILLSVFICLGLRMADSDPI
jgi:predicted permease